MKNTSIFTYVLVLIMIISCTSKPELIDPTVQVQTGLVKGVANESETVVVFKGIPYAAPPLGTLRWREPQPPLSWEGVRDASKFCASCIQNKAISRLPWTEEFMVQNEICEDCLFLNIWTPADNADANLPVFVYIHGGGFSEGSGAIDVYNGEELAKKGVIVVTINYRVGVLGFLAHPELTAESPNGVSGNYGLMDQLAALKWIKSNIAAFGGNPNKVTISGQSAGAMSVTSLLISPLASGYFRGAITQSGSSYAGFMGRYNSVSDAEQSGIAFMEQKGASSIADLRAMSAEEIMAPIEGETRMMRFSPVVDGYFLPGNSREIFAEGKQNDVPFITGLNADETRYRGEKNEKYFELYPSVTAEDSVAAQKLVEQEQSRLNAYLWLEHRAKTSNTNGYVYYFDRAIPWPEHPEFGAFHTGEVPYVFNNLKTLNRPWTAVDTMVADAMSSYWVNFIKNGNPNGEGLPAWKPYAKNSREVMRIGENMGMIPVCSSEEKYDFLKDQLLGD